MSECQSSPALGDRALPDVFASAARGCATDQELMCHITIASSSNLCGEASLCVAELWARMAATQCSQSIRLTFAQILGSQAIRHTLSGNDAVSLEYAAEAITIYDRLAEEGDPDAIYALDHFFGHGERVDFRDAVLKRAKEMQAA
jgi:hypothetical protein